MKYRMISILILTVVVLNSCAQSKVIEDLGIMNVYGVDISEHDQVDTTAVYYKFGSKDKGLKRVDTASGKTLSKAQKQMNYKRGYQLDAGAIQLELFGKNAAKKGLIPYARAAVRGARFSDTRLWALSDTTANDLITNTKDSERASIEHTMHEIIGLNVKKGIVPQSNLHDFLHSYYDAGMDPVLPVFSFHHGVPELTALALLKKDKLVGQIPVDKAFFINMFHNKIKDMELEFPLPRKSFEKHFREKPETEKDHFYTLVRVTKGKSNTELIDKQNQHYRTELNFNLEVVEITENLNLQDKASMNRFTKELEKEIEQQYEQLLTKLQKLNTDSFGYGQIYKTKKRNGTLTDSEWRDKFPSITVDVDANVDVQQEGVTP